MAPVLVVALLFGLMRCCVTRVERVQARRSPSRQCNRNARDGQRTKGIVRRECGIRLERRRCFCPDAAVRAMAVRLLLLCLRAPGLLRRHEEMEDHMT